MLADRGNPFRNILHGLTFAVPGTIASGNRTDRCPRRHQSGAGVQPAAVFLLRAGLPEKILFTRRVETSHSVEFRGMGEDNPSKRIVVVFPVDE